MPVQTSEQVRDDLVRALRLDLVGPVPTHHLPDAPLSAERLPMSPSRWYLTGFLVPNAAPEEQRSDEASQEELDLAGDADADGDEDRSPEKAAARRVLFPSSLGISVLIPAGVEQLEVVASWGDYVREATTAEASEDPLQSGGASPPSRDSIWQRTQRTEAVRITIPEPGTRARSTEVPRSGGLKIVASARRTVGDSARLPAGTRAVAVFLVNTRPAAEDEEKDRAFAFQATLELRNDAGFVPRPDPRDGGGDDWDDVVADLQYADVVEFATGHGVSCDWEGSEGRCFRVWTTWTPHADVLFTEPARLPDAVLGMEALARLGEGELRRGLAPLDQRYGEWIADRRQRLPTDGARARTTKDLLDRAEAARARIARGIELLEGDATVRRAFQVANSSMAEAARHREAQLAGKEPSEVDPPAWRPFQLAFILLNLHGIADPRGGDREVVDLLFFPTGGGKTEAYLGLAAFTLVLRRLRNHGMESAGMSVLMRYTLRLLTLDQLSRAAGLICALEQRRLSDTTLGNWPFEIGLWVGRTATPNRMGDKGDQDDTTARKRTRAFQQDSKHKPAPIPIENCPWCGTRFTSESFRLWPNPDKPKELRVICANPLCPFTGDRALPIVAVDEPLYRRLPCFVIATVDKFASLPFEGRAGALFGLVDRYDQNGFYGPADPGEGSPLAGGRLLPPDLIIQDELHLISGPLGTIAGLYEAAIDHLATREENGQRIRPKVIASTATVRRAEKQIRALFTRKGVELFPPASPDRSDSFFARTAAASDRAPRLYLGLAAPGRSLKVLMLRAYIALLSGSYHSFRANRVNGGDRPAPNPADPYLTLLGYFNALRELGGARRIIEDEVNSRVRGYGQRRRLDEAVGLFEDREIEYEVLELTSRVSTDKVSAAKRRLGLPWRLDNKGERVDVALATNMISVGLDISRLGLMVVLGQPRGSAEYIQCTSRVGRDPERPGLVVTLLTLNKARDRSHFERFNFYHRTFYRSVEATSVTPFAPRAVDRVLPALVVALARHGVPALTPPSAALEIESVRQRLGFILDALGRRVEEHDLELGTGIRADLRQKIQRLANELLDDWSRIAHEQRDHAAGLKYQQYEHVDGAQPLLHDPLEPRLAELSPPRPRFKAARSMRDVEPEVLLLKRGSPDGT